ncbi:MAG: HDOD domain-containing protein [Gammaproteobacteria bacterium]
MQIEEQLLALLLDDIEKDRLIIPSLPEVALRVRDAVADESATATQIANIVATDAGLSARLIQFANSPLYRGRNPIASLPQAVARLGNNVVRTLVSGLAMRQIFQATSDVLDAQQRTLWEHSVAVAAISRMLATPFKHLQPDQAMLAGLVHDIGTLPILARAEELPELRDDKAALDRVIMALHGRIGKLILETWGFPPEITMVASDHEDLYRDTGGEPDYVDVVLVANLQSYIGTDHPHTRCDWSAISAFNRLGIEPEISIVELEGGEEAFQEAQQLLA